MVTVNSLVEWAAANPQLALTVAIMFLGGSSAFQQYRRTGEIPWARFPWLAIRRVFYALRRTYAVYPRPDSSETKTVAIPIEDVTTQLGRQGYELKWPFSFHYKGEDLNARCYYYDPDRTYPHRQIHIRAWEHDNSTEIDAHEEPSALGHPKVHMQSSDMLDATDWVYRNIRDPRGLDPRDFFEEVNQSGSAPDGTSSPPGVRATDTRPSEGGRTESRQSGTNHDR